MSVEPNKQQIDAKRSRRKAERRVEQLAGLLASILAATLLMMWGVVNTVFNLMRMNDQPETTWLGTVIGGGLFLVTGVLPFVIGIFWLWKKLGQQQK